MILFPTESGFVVGGAAALLDENHGRLNAWAERYVRDDPDLRWLLGNYVEADTPNDNGHIFPLDDLREAQASLVGKPLNMMHREHYIVGYFAGAELVEPENVQASQPAKPFVEALAGLWHSRFPEEMFNIRRAHKEGSLFFCVDDETEVMARRGWSRFADLQVGEEILTLNTASEISEWLPCTRVHRYDYNGEMVKMEGMMHSSLTTPNHRWWVHRKRSRGGVVAEWRTSETLTTLCSIPRAAPHGGSPVETKYTDDLVELIAWLYTEGSVTGNSCRIYQSRLHNATGCARIRRCLQNLFGKPGRVREGGLWYEAQPEGTAVSQFLVAAEASAALLDHLADKVPTPEFLCALTAAQLRLFVETSIDADGSRAVADGQVSFVQKDERRIRAFEMACALLGLPTNTSKVMIRTGRYAGTKLWRCCVIRRSDWVSPLREDSNRRRGVNPGSRFTVERVPYTGPVWCPSTRNGTFLARRRGTVYWTGNSMETVPEEVSCPTCQARAAFAGFESETYCEHMQGATAPKVLHRPHFAGGAVIIPPVKPGWSRADVTAIARAVEEHYLSADLLAQVAAEAPHLSAERWREVMAQLLTLTDREFSSTTRKKMADKGTALPDGSYPIASEQDLRNAIHAIGRAKDPAAARAHIKKRARALGLSHLVPAGW
ncbi:portal protein [Caudovirales GX15bay]|nr:portal protein [Caudovirales GX15bay]